MPFRPGPPVKSLTKKNAKKCLTFRAAHAIIITVIGGTKVNPKYRKEFKKIMEKSELFEKEIALIQDEALQRFVRYYLNDWTPDIF